MQVRRYEKERVENASTYWLLFELIWRDYFRFISIKFGDKLFKLGGLRDVSAYEMELPSNSRRPTSLSYWRLFHCKEFLQRTLFEVVKPSLQERISKLDWSSCIRTQTPTFGGAL
jgi:hypothetical protein